MGPNLTRLFAQSKYNGRYDGTDAMEIIECDRAQDKIHCILATHGEALITALEELIEKRAASLRAQELPELHIEWLLSKYVALLAQLEAEAQP